MAVCPDWAKAMVQNYRALFLLRNSREPTMTDDQIYTVVEEIGVLEDARETEAAILEEMS